MTTAVRPVLCGFCARAACDRCPGQLDHHGHHCACQHPKPAAGLSLISSPAAPDPAVDLRLDSALSGLHEALAEVDSALLPYLEQHTADPVPLVVTASALSELRKELGRLGGSVEAAACRRLRSGPITLPDGRIAERMGGAKRTAWDHDRLAHRVAERAVLTAATVADPETGEVALDEHLAAAVHAGVQELMACARQNWRSGELKRRGVPFDDLVTTEPGIASLRVSAPASVTP